MYPLNYSKLFLHVCISSLATALHEYFVVERFAHAYVSSDEYKLVHILFY
jgi:hypothetical protein